ncbi:MAG TPA: DUF3311 domain-containing protein [Gemmatimonadaceae bacterium]
MRWYRWLAAVPTLGMLGGVPFANRVRPYVFGLPFLLAWIVIWVVITSLTMALIFALDTAHGGHTTDAATASIEQSTST